MQPNITFDSTASVWVDLDGHYESRAFLYVAPRLSDYDIVQEMQWVPGQDVRAMDHEQS